MTDRFKNILSLEERDLLNDSMNSDIFRIYEKVLKVLVDDLNQDVLKYNLMDMTQKSIGEFTILKAKQQGAAKLLLSFTALKQVNNKKR